MQSIVNILVKPQGKARPRVTRHGAYTPAKTKAYEREVAMAWKQQHGGWYADRQIAVMIAAYFEPPKSVSKKKRAQMLSGDIRPTVKPDADNIAKAVCDALNGVAYKDDAQIVILGVRKAYADIAHVKVLISDAGFMEVV